MGAIYEFGVQRNARVVRAHIKATVHVILNRIWGLFGARFSDETTMSTYRVQMVPNYGDFTFRYCLYGAYGTRFSEYLEAIDSDFVLIDIGANQGLFSLVAARNPRCRRIIAIEPVRLTFDLLEANVALNNSADRTTLLNAALSDRTGVAEIAFKANHSGVASIAGHSNIAGKPTQSIDLIDAAGLDQHIPEGLPIYVKIDVEGHEDVVITELLKSAHADRIKAIFHELDERWVDAEAIRRQLIAAGFVRFRKFGIGRHYDIMAER